MSETYTVKIDKRTDWQRANEPDCEQAKKVLELTWTKRYRYFLDMIIKTEIIWLCCIGERVVMLENNDSIPVLCPLWPARVFAMMWMAPMPTIPVIEIRAMTLDNMMEEFFPALDVDRIAVCFDQSHKGPIIPVEKVVADLQKELSVKRRRLN